MLSDDPRIDTSPLPEAMAPGRMLAQIKARRAARGILSLTPGTPAHAAAVAARAQTDAERDGL